MKKYLFIGISLLALASCSKNRTYKCTITYDSFLGVQDFKVKTTFTGTPEEKNAYVLQNTNSVSTASCQ